MYSTTPESNTSSTTDPPYSGGDPGASGSSTGHHPQQPSTSTSSRGVKRDAEDDNDDDGGKNDASGQAEQPVKIKRTRRRKALNCEECRRLKVRPLLVGPSSCLATHLVWLVADLGPGLRPVLTCSSSATEKVSNSRNALYQLLLFLTRSLRAKSEG